MLHVASVCTPCCMLWHVVGSCCAKFETGQTFCYVQTDATTPNVACVQTSPLPQYTGYSQRRWELSRPFVHSCKIGKNLVNSCTKRGCHRFLPIDRYNRYQSNPIYRFLTIYRLTTPGTLASMTHYWVEWCGWRKKNNCRGKEMGEG